MNFLDIIILIPLVIFILKGLKKGLVIEIVSLIALFFGILAGIYLSDFVAAWLVKYWALNASYTYGVAFIMIFVAVIILMRIIAKTIEKFLDLTALGFFNKILGAVFGLLKVLFLISLVFYVINKFDSKEKLITTQVKNKSHLYKPISSIAPFAIPRIKSEYDKWQKKDSIPNQ
jgi:membrane protein required for colicin V production